jgi:CBS-domain-containing membrane protein
MADLQIRRMPVLDRNKRLVGIVSITDLAQNGESARAGETLSDIARPSGLHSQTI